MKLAYLSAVFDKTSPRRPPSSSLIVGEPGIGKSRLVRELFAYVDARPHMTTWRQGYCPPFGEDITYWALAEIVKGHAGIHDTDDVRPSKPSSSPSCPPARTASGSVSVCGPSWDSPAPDASREENFAAWLRFFEDVAADGPTVLVFEDLHWADEALLAFLEYLPTHVASVPSADRRDGASRALRAAPRLRSRAAAIDHLHLGPLSTAETARLVAGLLGEPDDRDCVIRHGGRTLRRQPLLRRAVRAAAERPDDGRAIARLGAGGHRCPPGYALPADQKTLLGDAAVVGSVFWDGVLVAMGAREPDEVDGMLSGLLERQLIRRIRESSMEGEREFAFVHALARDVAYRQLPRAARARRHGAVARWLEAKAEGHPEDLAEVLAHHFATALDLAQAAGESELAAQFEGPSVRCLTLAGDRAFNLDVHAAERFYAAALEVPAADGPGRARLHLRLGEAALWSGRSAEAATHLDLAAVALRATGDLRSAAAALARLARARDNLQADPHEVAGLYREAVGLLHDDGPSEARVTVLTEWGRELGNAGEAKAALEAFEEALEVARELGVPEPPLALSLRGSIRGTQGDPGFLEDYRRALAVAEMRGLGIERARIWGNFAMDIGLVEGPRRSLEEYERVLAFEVQLGSALGYARDNRVVALVCAGDWDEALREANELERDFLARSLGGLRDLLLVHLVRLLPLVWRGADAEVRKYLSPTVDEARRSGVAVDLCWGLTVAAIATAPHDLGEARALLEEMASTAKHLHDVSLYHMLPEAVRVALHCGDSELAERISGVVRGRLPAVRNTQASVSALRGEARGEHEAAAAGFADAASRWHDFGVPYEEAQALLGQGRCLVALGKAPEAAAPLAAAREIFVRLGAKPALAETDGLMQQVASA